MKAFCEGRRGLISLTHSHTCFPRNSRGSMDHPGILSAGQRSVFFFMHFGCGNLSSVKKAGLLAKRQNSSRRTRIISFIRLILLAGQQNMGSTGKNVCPYLGSRISPEPVYLIIITGPLHTGLDTCCMHFTTNRHSIKQDDIFPTLSISYFVLPFIVAGSHAHTNVHTLSLFILSLVGPLMGPLMGLADCSSRFSNESGYDGE